MFHCITTFTAQANGLAARKFLPSFTNARWLSCLLDISIKILFWHSSSAAAADSNLINMGAAAAAACAA
jgi:hypothetical protein